MEEDPNMSSAQLSRQSLHQQLSPTISESKFTSEIPSLQNCKRSKSTEALYALQLYIQYS